MKIATPGYEYLGVKLGSGTDNLILALVVQCKKTFLTVGKIFAKENPSGSDEGTKSDQKSEEEPDLGSAIPETSIRVGLSS